jgi:hypothetical protein
VIAFLKGDDKRQELNESWKEANISPLYISVSKMEGLIQKQASDKVCITNNKE